MELYRYSISLLLCLYLGYCTAQDGMAVISFDRSEYDISGRSNLVAMVIGKNLQEQINITIVTSNDTGVQLQVEPNEFSLTQSSPNHTFTLSLPPLVIPHTLTFTLSLHCETPPTPGAGSASGDEMTPDPEPCDTAMVIFRTDTITSSSATVMLSESQLLATSSRMTSSQIAKFSSKIMDYLTPYDYESIPVVMTTTSYLKSSKALPVATTSSEYSPPSSLPMATRSSSHPPTSSISVPDVEGTKSTSLTPSPPPTTAVLTPSPPPTTAALTPSPPPTTRSNANQDGVITAISIVVFLLLLIATIAVVSMVIALLVARKKKRTHTYYTAGVSGNKFNHYIDVQVRTEEDMREKTPDSIKDLPLFETSFVGKGSTTVINDPYCTTTLTFKGELAAALKARHQQAEGVANGDHSQGSHGNLRDREE